MFNMETQAFEVSRILGLGAIAFMVAMLLTPLLSYFLFRYKLGKQIRQDPNTPIFNRMHKHKEGTPTMGGILIWGTVLLLVGIFALGDRLFPHSFFSTLNFFNRAQTLLPLGALVASALVGMADDLLGIFRIGPFGGGLQMRHRMLIYTAIATFGAWWFYWKLDWDLLHVPFVGDFNIGIWYVPYFIFVIVATAFSTNETDGLDGLAGGVLMIAFAGYGLLAFAQGRFDLAVFSVVIAGALLAFLWFNVHPARFFMGDTGAMSLGITLGIIAMLTNASLLLPIIGFVLVLESASVIIQMYSKKFRGKKIFLSTPLHQHFQAIGWSEPRVVMRFWIIAGVAASVGTIIGLLG